MEKLTTLTGVAVPLRRSNVDTDQIIPAVFLKRVKKSGFDDALFYAWRRDPEFVLNKPEYKQGKILVAGPDFGIGSSREHAVWALHDYGFRVAGHGDIHQRHVRMMSGGFVNRLASVGAGENNIEPACGIVFEDQPHGLADHRIVIDHANC